MNESFWLATNESGFKKKPAFKKKQKNETLSPHPRISERLLFIEYFGKSGVRDAIFMRGVWWGEV